MSLNEKAERLARGGAVTSLLTQGDLLSATVEGDSGTWKVTRDPDGWVCACPANQLGHRMCSHIGAVALYERWGKVYEAEIRARRRMAARAKTSGKEVSH